MLQARLFGPLTLAIDGRAVPPIAGLKPRSVRAWLAAYERCTAMLSAEFRTIPSDETRALARSLRSARTATGPPPPAQPPSAQPPSAQPPSAAHRSPGQPSPQRWASRATAARSPTYLYQLGRRSEMIDFEETVVCRASALAVWKLLYDPARYPEWWAGITRSEPTADGAVVQHSAWEHGDLPLLITATRDSPGVVIRCEHELLRTSCESMLATLPRLAATAEAAAEATTSNA